ncbi:MAG TPA: GDP-L-fucose synthase [Gemmatimonadaceae bacterium]|nr:GDP-L-fucose synthase [Gemmatimonadaceae bacterium]
MFDSSFWQGRRVLVTGASGFVGRNLVPMLAGSGCELFTPDRSSYDLLEQDRVRELIGDLRPEIVLHLAALSGGILANKTHPADYCYQNLAINTSVLHEAWRGGVNKFVTLIGGCSYPSNAPSPIREEEMWNGYPQAESAPYSLAKRMSIVMAEAYRRQHGFDAVVLVPGNLYGPHDNFDLSNSHVIPATIRKFHEAALRGDSEIVAWGTGAPVRDFIFVRDACEAILLATEKYSGPEIINLSSGVPTRIRELVETVADLTGFLGDVRWDASKPDGQMFKAFDVMRMHALLGQRPQTPLRQGLSETITWFKAHYSTARLAVPV